MANRRARMTKGQKETLIQYMEEHNIMLSPKVAPGDVPQIKNHWETVAYSLNLQAGAKKSVQQWKEAWNELKTNVRRKARENMYDLQGTGGGAKKAKELSELEDRIMGLISKIVIRGAPLPEAGVETGLMEDQTEVLLGEYIVLPERSAEVSTNPIPIVETEVQMCPGPSRVEAEVLTTPRPKAKKKNIPKRRNVTMHPMLQVVNTHEKCLNSVASSNDKIAEALMVLSASIARVGTSIAQVGKKKTHSAVFQLKF